MNVRGMIGRERRTGLECFSSESVLGRARSGDLDEVRWKPIEILEDSFSEPTYKASLSIDSSRERDDEGNAP